MQIDLRSTARIIHRHRVQGEKKYSIPLWSEVRQRIDEHPLVGNRGDQPGSLRRLTNV
jgi:hypothetical protein